MNDEDNNKQTRIYQIRIDGHLSDPRASCFEGLQIKQLPNGETLISGRIEDQAALFGMLIRIRDMGIPLLSVNYLNQIAS
jgi:hypothetical protein